MAIKLNSVKCPECNANLSIEEGRERAFCTYCGTLIIVTNENEHIYRHIDEARIKEAETNRTVELKKLEFIERKRVAAEKTKKVKIIVSIVIGIIGFLALLSGADTSIIVGILALEVVGFIWLFGAKDKDDDIDFGDKVKVPIGISDYGKKSYVTIEAMFKGAGFTNVKCVPLHDLIAGLLKRPDTVESITINGKAITSGGKKFSPDATVIISYHSYAGR